MAATLLKKLMDRLVERISRKDMRGAFYDILEALDGCYVLLEVSGDDGGTWLYKVVEASRLAECALEEREGQAFRERHFYIGMPDYILYDILLKEMTPGEAAAYAQWGGTASSHPSWVYLKSQRFFDLLQTAVDLG